MSAQVTPSTFYDNYVSSQMSNPKGESRHPIDSGSHFGGGQGGVRRTWISGYRSRCAGRTTLGGPLIRPAYRIAACAAERVERLALEQPAFGAKLHRGRADHVRPMPPPRSLDLPQITFCKIAEHVQRWDNVLSYAEVAAGAQRGRWIAAAQKVAVSTVPCSGKKQWTQKPHNLAQREAFRGVEALEAGLSEDPMYAVPLQNQRIEKILNKHVAVKDDCCVQRSLLAYCSTDQEYEYVESLPWGLTAGAQIPLQLEGFCKVRSRPGRLLLAGCEGFETMVSYGGAGDPVILVLAYVKGPTGPTASMEDFMQHCMPIHKLVREYRNEDSAMMRRIKNNHRRFNEFVNEMAQAAIAQFMAMQHQVQEEPPALECAQQEPLPPQAPAPELVATIRCESSSQTDWDGMAERQPGHFSAGYRMPVTNMQYGHCLIGKGWASSQTHGPCIYGGKHRIARVQEAPQSLRPHLARTVGAERSFTFCQEVGPEGFIGVNLLGNLYAPDFCMARADLLRRWGERTKYVFTEKRGRHFVNGRSDLYLSPAAILECNGNEYRFVRDDHIGCCYSVEAYRLQLFKPAGAIPARARTLLGSAIPICSWSSAEVRYNGGGPLDFRTRFETMWALEHQTEHDPLTASLLARARASALANESVVLCPSPEEVAAQIRALRKGYQSVQSVGGVFAWGFCYSCGQSDRGHYKGRLCKVCQSRDTPLTRLIGCGDNLCTAKSPILYPGVVFTQRQHPPLKAGTKTRATWGIDITVMMEENGIKKPATQARILSLPTLPGPGPTLGGVGLPGAIPFVTAAGVRPLVEAILYRVFKDLDTNADGTPTGRYVSKAAFSNATRLARSPLLLGEWLSTPAEPMPVEEWINSMSQSRRRKMLSRALVELKERGCRHPEFEYVKPFVKQELLAYFKPKNGLLTPEGTYVARLIQAPNDETHLIAGPFLKPLVGALKHAWNPENWLFYGSVKPEGLNRWLDRIKTSNSFYWSDYSAFDATFSAETWAMIEGFYKQVYPNAPIEFWQVMDIWRRPKGKNFVRKQKATVEYQAAVCNCSGRDDTALANALFNGLALAISIAGALAGRRAEEVREEDLISASTQCKISVVGDDSLVGCDFEVSEYAEKIEANLKSFGLIVKAEHSRHLSAVTYLGMMPYKVGPGQFQWGPTLGRRMYKLFWKRELNGLIAPWVRGIAQAMEQYHNVPILHELCMRVNFLLYKHSVTKLKEDENRIWTTPPKNAIKWSECTLDWLVERYGNSGLTKAMLKSDLELISKIDRLPAVVRLASLECILQADDL